MTDVVKLIHPKTGTVREIAVTNENKFKILKRAGFILFKDYKPPKPKEDVPEKTLAEIVASEGEKVTVGGRKVAAEVAEHEAVKVPGDEFLVSKAAAAMIETFGLDLALLTGTGQDGKITKTDVDRFLLGRTSDEEDGSGEEAESAQEASGEKLADGGSNLADDHEGDGLGDAGVTEGEESD